MIPQALAYDWKIGSLNIERTQHRLQKLIDIADLIRQAEEQHGECMRWSKTEAAEWFPELKEKSLRQARSKHAAAIRLRKYFTNILNDTSL